MRLAVRSASMVMVLGGVVLLALGANQFVGTGAETARAQARLRVELERHGPPRRPIPGGAVGFIRISRIAVDAAFVQGVSPASLAEGPGHYPQTPLPGWTGNTAIAGHRTTHGAPFWALDRLRPGDLIELRSHRGRFVYRVAWSKVVSPDDWRAIEGTPVASLTLTTCWPRFSSKSRLVVRAIQVYGRVPGGFLGTRGSPPTQAG
jgi:sortase A